MGYDDVTIFAADIERRTLRTVETHYAGLFEDAPSLAIAEDKGEGGNLVFTGTEDDPDTIATLARLGYHDPHMVAQTVRGWHHGRNRATRSNRARQLLTEVMPSLLAAFGKTAQPDAAFIRFDRCLAGLSAGVPLLSVFYSNLDLLDLVAEIMGDAPRVAEHVTRTPALLDYVLEPQFYAPIGPAAPRMDARSRRHSAAPHPSKTCSMCCAAGPTTSSSASASRPCAAWWIRWRRRGAFHRRGRGNRRRSSLGCRMSRPGFRHQFGVVPDGTASRSSAYGKLASRN